MGSKFNAEYFAELSIYFAFILYELFHVMSTSYVIHNKCRIFLRRRCIHWNVIYNLPWKIKAKIDETQKCKFCGEQDETVNQKVKKFNKAAQEEYKTMHGWVGRIIHWELCKGLNFDQLLPNGIFPNQNPL